MKYFYTHGIDYNNPMGTIGNFKGPGQTADPP